MTEIASEYAERSDYLYDRGFRRGRFTRYTRVRHDQDNQQLDYQPGGWTAFTVRWETSGHPDAITAFVTAELAGWGR